MKLLTEIFFLQNENINIQMIYVLLINYQLPDYQTFFKNNC